MIRIPKIIFALMVIIALVACTALPLFALEANERQGEAIYTIGNTTTTFKYREVNNASVYVSAWGDYENYLGSSMGLSSGTHTTEEYTSSNVTTTITNSPSAKRQTELNEEQIATFGDIWQTSKRYQSFVTNSNVKGIDYQTTFTIVGKYEDFDYWFDELGFEALVPQLTYFAQSPELPNGNLVNIPQRYFLTAKASITTTNAMGTKINAVGDTITLDDVVSVCNSTDATTGALLSALGNLSELLANQQSIYPTTPNASEILNSARYSLTLKITCKSFYPDDMLVTPQYYTCIESIPLAENRGQYPNLSTVPWNEVDNTVNLDVDFAQWISTAIGGIWKFELLPNFTVGNILTLLLALGLFVAFLKIFNGG